MAKVQQIKVSGAAFNVPDILSLSRSKFIEAWLHGVFYALKEKDRKEKLGQVYDLAVKQFGKPAKSQ